MDGFVRSRIEGVLDNLIAQVVVWLAVLGTPIVLGIVLHLGWVTTALLLLLACQIVVIVLLVSIRRRSSSQPGRGEPLVQHSATALVHLADRFGFRRPIPDAETAAYLEEILGYQAEDIPVVGANSLRPTGPPVRSVRKWKTIPTRDSHISFEASRSLRLLSKSVRSDAQSSTLSFHLRNDSDIAIRIDSAQLVCDLDAPLRPADISPRNTPITLGLMTCRLLFEGQSGSKSLLAAAQSTLELLLTRPLSKREADTLKTVHLGYIAFDGMFRDNAVSFHMQV